MTCSVPADPSSRFTTHCDLSAEGVSCERDDRILFEDLSLSVKKGDLIQLVGPNGAGKTTLLRLMAGIKTLMGKFAGMARIFKPAFMIMRDSVYTSVIFLLLKKFLPR